MIDLTILEESQTNLYQEDIKDSLNIAAQVAGVDTDSIGKTLSNPNADFLDKATSINDNGIDQVRKTTDSLDRVLSKRTVDTRSIIARARNSVLQFPIYVPQTIRVNEAHIIGKMFERVYTTLVQTVLAQNPIMDEEQANNLVFLKQFHSNIREATDVLVNQYYTPIDEIDSMMTESIFFTQQLTENCKVTFSVVPCTNQNLILENARLINEPLAGIVYLHEDTNEKEKKKQETKSNDVIQKTDEVNISLRSVNKEELEELADNRGETLDELKQKIKDKEVKDYVYRDGRYCREERTRKIVLRDKDDKKAIDAPKILKDSDIKKLNGLLPYTIEATFTIRTKQGLNRDVRYVIGIKSVLHLFRTKDLADDLRELVTGNIHSLQKVRYKTGEINFRDYFFNIKGLKADAAKHINYDKRWLNTLKRLADYRQMHGSLMKKPIEALTNGNVPIPNGTLVLTQPDVTLLTNQTGIDLSIVSNAKRLARSMFLIAVVIVDSSAGTMRVLFTDSDNEWDVQSLAAIDAELAKTDNSQLMKELNRMVNK